MKRIHRLAWKGVSAVACVNRDGVVRSYIMCIDVYDIRRKDSFPWSYETPLWSIGLPMIMGVTYREGDES